MGRGGRCEECCFVLFCFVLFCFVLFCFVLFCFVLFGLDATQTLRYFLSIQFLLFCFPHLELADLALLEWELL